MSHILADSPCPFARAYARLVASCGHGHYLAVVRAGLHGMKYTFFSWFTPVQCRVAYTCIAASASVALPGFQLMIVVIFTPNLGNSPRRGRSWLSDLHPRSTGRRGERGSTG